MANDHLEHNRFKKLPFGIEPKKDPREQETFTGTTDDGELDPFEGEPEKETDPDKSTSKNPTKKTTDPLKVPAGFKIVSQEIRWTPTGEQVVDVIIEFNEYDPGVGFEHRITKV